MAIKGNYYYCVISKLSKDGEIYACADSIEYTDAGDLILKLEDGRTVLAISAGRWSAVFAASHIDGHAVFIEHWDR